MDRDVLDVIEREIDQEAKARFPGTAVRQAMLLQYGDDPEIEPGALWVRVLLNADRAEDHQETLTAFDLATATAREQFTSFLAGNSQGSGSLSRAPPPTSETLAPPERGDRNSAECTPKLARHTIARTCRQGTFLATPTLSMPYPCRSASGNRGDRSNRRSVSKTTRRAALWSDASAANPRRCRARAPARSARG
jgi:hypothetical protein